MEATAWNNGEHHPSGAGYGIRIHAADRDRFFDRKWSTIQIIFPNDSVAKMNIDKDSFWGSTCRELISREIGKWLLSERLAPWPSGAPPKFILEVDEGYKFTLTLRDS